MLANSLIGIAVLLALAFALKKSSAQNTRISRAATEVQKTGELEPLLTVLRQTPRRKRDVQWDQALDILWRNYARIEAAKLIMEASDWTDGRFIQYWIRRVLEVEPEIAEEVFTAEFMENHFKPEVAAKCEKGCGCG